MPPTTNHQPSTKHNRSGLALAAMALAIGLGTAAPQSAWAVTSTLFTTAASDGGVIDRSPFDGTFEDAFSNGDAQAIFSAGNEEFRGILEFEVLGIPMGAMITGVELELESIGNANSAQFFLYAGNGSVDIPDATDGTLLGTFVVPSNGNLFTQALPIPDFQTLFDNSATHFGLRFQITSGSTVVFSGAETANVAPTLRVTFDNPVNTAVPEPITATLGLMGLGVLGMATQRRRMV